jgi:hypothetical protein
MCGSVRRGYLWVIRDAAEELVIDAPIELGTLRLSGIAEAVS